MYGKQNKLSQLAPILSEISVRISDSDYGNVNDKCAIFL